MKKAAKKNKEKRKFLVKIRDKITKKIYVSAIVLAGGSGTRVSSDVTKQWIFIDGIPVVIRSLLQFQNCKQIDEIIISAKEDEIPLYDSFIDEYNLTKVKSIVKGGETRGVSALNGFKKISDFSTFVLFHDAARCLVTEKNITDSINAAKKYRCACAATISRDTVKFSKKRALIDYTLDRNCVWLAQTPQVFRTEIYRASAYYAIANNFSGTDDASLAENVGFKIKLVDTGDENIKITTKTDLYLAEAILKMRKENLEKS